MSQHDFKVVFFDLGETLVTDNRTWLVGAKALLTVLKSAGYRPGIISNTDTLTRAQLLNELPADFDLLDFEPALVLFSSEVGFAKPNPKIFKAAVAAAQVPAAQCLFCTEDAVHALVAQHVGMRALRVQQPPHHDLPKVQQFLSDFHQAIQQP